jgi:hypothetical protein
MHQIRNEELYFWIQMNFYPNLSGITRGNLLSFLLYSKRIAKNPLFEAISLLVPTGPQ